MLSLDDLQRYSPIAWIDNNRVNTEKGELFEFKDHPFLFDIVADQAPKQVIKKCAQVGLSTCACLKVHWLSKYQQLETIYTLPTQEDVQTFVGGKYNRIIINNPSMLEDVRDKDSVEQKSIGQSMVYFRGTWTAKAAIMIPADMLVHDEIDSSKLSVVADFQSRLQHSKHKRMMVFSHPSAPNIGVDAFWKKSDQKEWFVRCPHCNERQYLSWDTENEKRMSIDIERGLFVCKKCRKPLSDDDRRGGEWVYKKANMEYSGYHVSLLMAPWVTAKEIVEKWNEVVRGKQTVEFFFNKVLGEPSVGSGNNVTEDTILGNVRNETKGVGSDRVVIGVDTGLSQHFVIGNQDGLLGYGEKKTILGPNNPDSIEYLFTMYPKAVIVIDAGGELLETRELRKRHRGRVFLTHYSTDRKTMQLIRWGEGDEYGNVVVDRNRMIQMVIDEFKARRIGLYNGNRNDWHDYWVHWMNIHREVKEDAVTQTPKYVWVRDDADHWTQATVYYRVGMDRYVGGGGSVYSPTIALPKPNSFIVNPDETVTMELDKLIMPKEGKAREWRR